MRCVLVHAGIADARMWDPVIPWFQGHEPVSYDLRGFGQMDDAEADWHHVDDLLELLGDEPAMLVGASLGGRVCLEAAVLRPELVSGLVLIGTALPGAEWRAESIAYDAAEEELLAAGDVEGVAALNTQFWVVGVGRTADDVPHEIRDLTLVMQRRALTVAAALGYEESPRVEDLRAAVGALRVPALVLVGEHDIPEMHENAAFLADAIPGARLEVVPGGHLPSLEEPKSTGAQIERFLAAL